MDYYDRLSKEINIPGIKSVKRDTTFGDIKKYNSGGIRLYYKSTTDLIEGVKHGILLEAGYDSVAPNNPVLISSWAYERAGSISGIEIIDNRAKDILCYDPRYTFVEKLQSIATKFHKEKNIGEVCTNYMRQYYDVYCLLDDEKVVQFIGTEEYRTHKEKRFHTEYFNIPVSENPAFLLRYDKVRREFQKRYESTKAFITKGNQHLKKSCNEFINT